MTRLDHLREAHARPLLQAFLAREHGPERAWADAGAEALFARFAEADPTVGKPHLAWVLRLYLAGRLPAEDLYKVPETLQLFRRARRHLAPAARQLDTYVDLPALWRAVAPFAQVPSKRERVAEERERARAESRMLHEDAELLVAVPHTEFAATWWGRGTRWCTAAEEHNAFAEYDRAGPLVVFIVRGAKFQFHAPTDSFHDDADGAADVLAVLGPFFSQLEAAGLAGLVFALDPLARPPEAVGEEALRSALADWGLPLYGLPEPHRDARRCQLAVERSAANLAHVPEPLRTQALCLQAVRRDGAALVHVPHALRDRALCLAALQSGASLKDVPDPLRDRALCLEAVRRPRQLNDVPWTLRDAELCHRAFEGQQVFLDQVPRAFRDRELCQRAMAEDGDLLSFVPEAFRDRALCLSAVSSQGISLLLVPLAMRDLELCTAAARSEPLSLFLAPPELRAEIAAAAGVDLNEARVQALLTGLALVPFAERTPERCLREAARGASIAEVAPDVLRDRETCLAIAAQGVLLDAVPEAFRTREVCLRNLCTSPRYGLGYVPEDVLDVELCLEAMRVGAEQLYLVPEPLRTEAVCLAAVKQWGFLLPQVPWAVRTRAVCLEALRRGGALEDVPEALRDEELCRVAVDEDGPLNALPSVPFALRTEALCREMVARQPRALAAVPHALRDAAMCMAAVAQVPSLRRHVPASVRPTL
ncbi:DUF4116 domain-containing protein [Archangium primigenium]|uniref:DUF4116 domain-containing protein n=1 Tax=[Archangium] primigenium TaxID=2792470 RepID=UPI0019579DE0|nr:DUF4116 domain-containing protein [Archangium primigenium]MBM7112843.1 DUF4116 domain-containing protein [Archangium primigenium]